MENKRTSRKRLTASKKRNMRCKREGCKNHSMHGGYCSQHGGMTNEAKATGGRRRRRTASKRRKSLKKKNRKTKRKRLMKRKGGNDGPQHRDAYCKALKEYNACRAADKYSCSHPTHKYLSRDGYEKKICEDGWKPEFSL